MYLLLSVIQFKTLSGYLVNSVKVKFGRKNSQIGFLEFRIIILTERHETWPYTYTQHQRTTATLHKIQIYDIFNLHTMIFPQHLTQFEVTTQWYINQINHYHQPCQQHMQTRRWRQTTRRRKKRRSGWDWGEEEGGLGEGQGWTQGGEGTRGGKKGKGGAEKWGGDSSR